jgi:hypothetical protein
MSRYLNLLAGLSRTSGNDLSAYLALAVAAGALPGAALIFGSLGALALLRRLLSAGAEQLSRLLHCGRVLLAARLRQAADLIDPRPVDESASAPTVPPAVEAVPVPMPAAARVTVEAPDRREDARERLAAALAEHGSIRAAARALGIGESTLRGRSKRYGTEAPRSRRGRKAWAATAA